MTRLADRHMAQVGMNPAVTAKSEVWQQHRNTTELGILRSRGLLRSKRDPHTREREKKTERERRMRRLHHTISVRKRLVQGGSGGQEEANDQYKSQMKQNCDWAEKSLGWERHVGEKGKAQYHQLVYRAQITNSTRRHHGIITSNNSINGRPSTAAAATATYAPKAFDDENADLARPSTADSYNTVAITTSANATARTQTTEQSFGRGAGAGGGGGLGIRPSLSVFATSNSNSIGTQLLGSPINADSSTSRSRNNRDSDRDRDRDRHFMRGSASASEVSINRRVGVPLPPYSGGLLKLHV